MYYKTFLPVFSGFYETIWQCDYDYIEDFIKEERKNKGLFSEIDFNDLKIDVRQYENDIVKSICQRLPRFMPNFIEKIILEDIKRPKEYNFYNDSANVKIKVNEKNIAKFIYENKEKFCDFLKKRYTSYDGFISHYENDFETWEKETKSFTNYKINGHYLGAILEFIAIIKDVKEYDIFEDIQGNMSILDYVENLNDVIEKQDGSLFELLTSHGINKDFADYIQTSFNNNVIQNLYLSEKILSLICEYKNNLIIS